MIKQAPTRRQLEVLWAYIDAGSIAAAAFQLGISETTARQHLSGLYRRTGCLNAAQAAYWLGRSSFPADGSTELSAARVAQHVLEATQREVARAMDAVLRGGDRKGSHARHPTMME